MEELESKKNSLRISKFLFMIAVVTFLVSYFTDHDKYLVFDLGIIAWFGVDYIIHFIDFKFEENK